MKVFIAICIVVATLIGPSVQDRRWEPLRIPVYTIHLDDVGIATNVTVVMTNNEVYGLSRPRISNYTKDPAGKFDGFTLTLDRVFSRGRHATTGSTSLVTSGAFSESGNYYINAKKVQLQHAVGTGDRTISVASVRTWFDGYGNKRMARTVNDYLSTHAPAAIAANQEFVFAEIDKVVKSWNDSRIKV